MRRNATNCDEKEGVLIDRHLAAIEVLVVGGSLAEASEKAGVARSTLSRWMHKNPYFMAALSKRRSEIRNALKSKIVQAVHVASDAVISGLQDPEVPPVVKLQTACSLLHKLFPFINGAQYGPMDAEAVATEMSPNDEIVSMFDSSDPVAARRLLEESKKDLMAV